MTTSLEFQIAERCVNDFVGEWEGWKADHHDVMECYRCQDWLQTAIDAFRWIRRAEEAMNQADRLGIRPISCEEQLLADNLYLLWLKPCAATEAWINDLDRRGHQPDNLAEFRELCSEARATIEDREWAHGAAEAVAVAFEECTTAE